MSEFETKKLKKKWKPERMVLEEGLELWKVPLNLVLEQDTNARSMPSDMFLQLVDNIQRDKRLESLPLCAATFIGEGEEQKIKIEIISGHHRTRAARKAGMDEVWSLIDVTSLSRDRIRSKQLAHNSISGSDNPDIVAQIFAEIEDVDARIEAFVMPDLSKEKLDVAITADDLNVELNAKVVTLLFLPAQHTLFKDTLDRLCGEEDDVFLAKREEYDMLIEAVNAVSAAYEIRSTPTIFARMAEIVMEHLKKEKSDE